jgi:hypothetical protein
VGSGTTIVASTVASQTVGAVVAAGAAGPPGWVILGADVAEDCSGTVTWDCWKPVLLDHSASPSGGRPWAEVVQHPNVKGWTVHPSTGVCTITNIQNTTFRVERVTLPDGALALHAVRM